MTLILRPALLAVCAALSWQGTPSEPRTIHMGDPAIDATLYEPHVAVVTQTLTKDGQAPTVTAFRNELSLVEIDGEHRFHIVTHGEGWDLDVLLEQRSFAVLRYELRLAAGGFTLVELDGAKVTGRRRSGPEAEEELLAHELEVAAMPAGMIDGIVGALPLAPGYAARLPVFQPGRPEVQWRTYRVTGREAVQVAGRELQAWIVAEEGQVSGTMWLVNEPPYMVRWVLRAPSGQVLTLEQELVKSV